MSWSTFFVCREEIEETKKTDIKGNKTITSISAKPEIMHQSSKDQRVIAATDYFNTATLQSYFILTMCLIPFHSPNGPCTWLSVLFWKRPTKLLERPPSLIRPASLPCQSAILFPDSTVISQPSGAALPDLCLDLRLNSPSSSTSSSLESRLGPPLLIYEPFHTVLLPLETQPWPTLHGTLLALNTQSTPAGPGVHGWWVVAGGLMRPLDLSHRYCHTLGSRLHQTIRERQIYQSTSWLANISHRQVLRDQSPPSSTFFITVLPFEIWDE